MTKRADVTVTFPIYYEDNEDPAKIVAEHIFRMFAYPHEISGTIHLENDETIDIGKEVK